ILFALLVSIPIVFFSTFGRLFGTATPAADQAAIRAALDAQVAAWNKRDLDGFMAGYWNDDALSFSSEDHVTTGWKATKERYQNKYWAPNKEIGTLSFEELQVEGVSPTVALVRGKYVLVKKAGTDTGRFTLVFRKFPDGWKITSDHTSAACPPVPEK